MANNIRNLQKLSSDELATVYFATKFQKVLDMTMKELLDKLDEIIDADVYSWDSRDMAQEPWGFPDSPHRSGQFKESWENEKSEIVNNIVESKIFQNISTMRQFYGGTNNDVLVHEDRENLAEYINNNSNYKLPHAQKHINNKPKEPFWDDFKVYVDINLDRIFLENCRKLGIDIK